MSTSNAPGTPPPEIPPETDPRFPSGRWRGYWTQHGIKAWMELNLTFSDGRIQGDGTDAIGGYAMRGTYDLDNGKVIVRKHYYAQHMVAYTGTAGDDGHLRGRWDIRCCHDTGDWHIWPVGKAEGAVATAEVADCPRLITSWQEFEQWCEELVHDSF